MRQLISLMICLAVCLGNAPSLYAQDCTCTNCPQFMPDLFVGDFNLNIQGATNNMLGQNGQGVCGVIVHFDHTAICDISITLTAPSGQSVVLVGPIGQFCTNMGNAGTDWNVTFLPCGGGVIPDPGFADQWNSNQPWGGGNNYSGSYYPFAGCLQNLTGPVNGNWTLTVNDAQANDTGNLYNFEIIFCDPSGINCVSCAADAGALLQADVMACQGSPDLVLDLPPTYNPPSSIEPPASDYTYAYVVAGSNGVIQSIATTPDLTALLAGNYTVCGLSYLTQHQNLLPAPGSITVTQLATQLGSNTPPFCGSLTSNCVNVQVLPLPPDEEETVEVCAPECYDFLGQFYCQTGDYTVEQTDANGCAYNSILHLTVKNPTFRTISETICPGTCSSHPLFPGVCSNGQYQITLTGSNGCDSILTLNLTVMAIDAVIQPPPMLSCVQTTAPLSGTGSTAGAGVTYTWTASNGGVLTGPTNQINATAAAPGNYKLLVCRTLSGVTCCDSAIVTVTSSVVFPGLPVIQGPAGVCLGDTIQFHIAPLSGATSYTWTTPSGVNILSGQNDTLITVFWNTAVSGNICVFGSNACGPGPQACLNVQLLQTPINPVLTGSQMVCRDSIVQYAADTIPGVSIIDWIVTGGVIQSGDSSYVVQVVWNATGAGTICGVALNNCGASDTTCLPVIIDAVPLLVSGISGAGAICAGDTVVYSTTPVVGALGYNWTVGTGGVILTGNNSTSITVLWTNAPGSDVCVHAYNACGAGNDACLPVVVFSQVIANAGVDSDTCGLSIPLGAIQSVPGSTGAWSQLAGPSALNFSDVNSPTALTTASLAGQYSLLWQETNGSCTDVDTVMVSFFSMPVGGAPQISCDATNQNYTVSFAIAGGAPPYLVVGGSVTGNVFTSDLIVNGQAYVFQITDGNGCESTQISGVFNCNCATNAGQMNLQPLSACVGDSLTALPATGANFDGDDVGAYYLHDGAGAALGAIFGQNTIGTFGFTTGMTAGQTYYISYVVGNNNGGFPNLSDPCLSVSPGQTVVFFANPIANAGQDVSACGFTAQVTGTAVNGTVVWNNVPPGALSITTPSNAVTQVVGTSLGMFQLAYTVTVNGCSDTDTVSVHFTGNPATTTPVYTCDPTNQFYTVTFTISGGGLAYTVNGSAVVGDTFVSGAIPNGGSHNFVVFDDNGCPAPLVSGSFACDCATNAGQINTTPVTVCQSDSVYVQLLGGQNTDADDVLVYVLHTGPPDTIGTVIAVNNTGAFGFWATMNFGTTYYLSVAAGNNQNGFPDPSDPCFDVTTGKPVVFQQDPVPNAGDNFVVCGLTANMPAIASGFAGQWTQTGGSPAIAIASTSDPKTMITASAAGTYQFHWTETNGQCGAFDSLEVTFLQNPAIDTIIPVCDGTNTAYTISFDVLAGNGGYQITGLAGSFNGTTFTSVPLSNGVPYTFQVQDLFGCQSVVYNGSHLCPCTSDAGTMDQTPAVFCADMPAVATWNNDATLDANDGVQFILHDAAGNSPGTILATNSQPIFNFGSGLQTGTTYYISAIVGNLTGGAIDPNDLCKSVAAGTPVQWKMLPDAVLTGDATICNGSSTVLNINGNGAFPLLVMYQDGSGTTSTAALNNAQTFTLAVTPLLTTTYTLVSVSDGTTPMCSATLNSSVIVQVNQPVNAGIAAPPQELCAGTHQPIDLRSLLTGENPGGVWIETSAAPSTGTAFNSSAGTFNASNQLPGVYTFRYQVQALAPCPNQSTTVTVNIQPTPVADAGLDQVIDCKQDSVLLGGTGTTTGAGIQYNWSLSGNTLGTEAVYQTGTGGTYNLLITNEFGCTATDATTVTVNDDLPVAKQINVQQISCNGANDGAIELDSIVSAFEPVLISINGGLFESDRTFENLEPGFYTIILRDANECIWTPGSITINEPPLTTVDLGAEVIVMLGDSVHLQATVSLPEAALDTFFWRPLFDPAHATTFMQSFLPFKSSYVTLSVIDSNGCEASSTVLVRVERPEQVYIPNVIYPESGNDNARLTVYGGVGVARIEYFRIFDRWGDQVFSAENFTPNDPGNGWDATHRGDLVSPGVYVYVAKVHFVDGAVEIYKGDVTVVR